MAFWSIRFQIILGVINIEIDIFDSVILDAANCAVLVSLNKTVKSNSEFLPEVDVTLNS